MRLNEAVKTALNPEGKEEIWLLVKELRLTVRYCADGKHVLTKPDLEEMYEDLCRLSMMLIEGKAEEP